MPSNLSNFVEEKFNAGGFLTMFRYVRKNKGFESFKGMKNMKN